MDWKKFAWLKRGKRRSEVLNILYNSNRPLTIKEIKNTSKIAMSQASFIVSDLLENGLITCLNPDDKIGKLFEITNEGKNLLNFLKNDGS
jgi:predicted transcriptional regulator